MSGIKGTARRATAALEYAVIGKAVADLAVSGWNTWKARAWYTVSVAVDEPIYPLVQAWLMEHVPSGQQRSLGALSRPPRANKGGPEFGPPGRRQPHLAFHYDGDRPIRIVLDGHPIRAHLQSDNVVNLDADGPTLRGNSRLTLTARTVAGRDAIQAQLRRLAVLEADREPVLFIGTRWGDGWNPTGPVPERPLASVVLHDNQLLELVKDARTFLASEVEYATWGMPYHRGYLLAGPAGTGKTSTISALCRELGLDVYYLSLANIQGDASLATSFANVPPRSCLVIEDIDCAKAAVDRDADNDRHVTVAGLLNALDGFMTPHGLITVMTTNRPELLDPALVRPGRVDRRIDVGLLTTDQAIAIAAYFRPDLQLDPEPWVDRAPAELIGYLREAA